MAGTDATRPYTRPLIVAGAAAGAALAGTLWLWAEYGTDIFFETVRAGFAACFG